MALRFTHRRRIEGVDPSDASAQGRPWLNRETLSATDQRQLLSNLLSLEDRENLTEDDVWEGDWAFFDEHFDALAETPIEAWDVVDAVTSKVHYQLWLAWVDGGVLVEAGTTRKVAEEGIVQGYWHGDADLGEALERAREALQASREHPDSLVLRVRFRATR